MSDRMPTFADICSAIADGSVPATLDGSTYLVNAFELRRYLNKFRSLPAISSTDSQLSSPRVDPGDWSASVQSSVA